MSWQTLDKPRPDRPGAYTALFLEKRGWWITAPLLFVSSLCHPTALSRFERLHWNCEILQRLWRQRARGADTSVSLAFILKPFRLIYFLLCCKTWPVLVSRSWVFSHFFKEMNKNGFSMKTRKEKLNKYPCSSITGISQQFCSHLLRKSCVHFVSKMWFKDLDFSACPVCGGLRAAAGHTPSTECRLCFTGLCECHQKCHCSLLFKYAIHLRTTHSQDFI